MTFEPNLVKILEPQKHVNSAYSELLYNDEPWICPFENVIDKNHHFTDISEDIPSLTLYVTRENLSMFQLIYDTLIDSIHNHSERFFQNQMSKETLREFLKMPCILPEESMIRLPIPSSVVWINDDETLEMDFFEKYQSQMAKYYIVLKGIRYRKTHFFLDMYLHHITTYEIPKPLVPKNIGFIDSPKRRGIERFLSKRDQCLGRLSERIEEINQEMKDLEIQKQEIQEHMNSILESDTQIQEGDFTYQTDDEYLEEETEKYLF